MVLMNSFNSTLSGKHLFCPSILKKIFKRFYLFIDRGEGRERERERSINVWMPLACSQLGILPATQACDPLVCRLALNPLSHTSQGQSWFFIHCINLKDWCNHLFKNFSNNSTETHSLQVHELVMKTFWCHRKMCESVH